MHYAIITFFYVNTEVTGHLLNEYSNIQVTLISNNTLLFYSFNLILLTSHLSMLEEINWNLHCLSKFWGQ